jgi:Geranylgeranyl pyrophosphate synthase
LFGQEAIAGKSLGTDLAKGKLTLPILLVWERATSSERVLVQQWIQSWETDTLKPLGELLTKYDALGLAQQSIHFYLKRAGEYLRALPASRGRSGLAGLTDYLAHQTAALGIRA